GNATATATSLLPVPTYATASTSAFATATAKALASALPGYTYNLTMETESTRTSICNQTTAFCSTAGCSKSSANVTTNFCNPTTMGWNCDCNDGADSRLQLLTVPVNTYGSSTPFAPQSLLLPQSKRLTMLPMPDCRLRTAACLDQCSNRNASPAVASVSSCQNACNYILGSTCGTSSQVLPEYQVKKYSDKPNTSKGGVAMGITTSSSPASHALSHFFAFGAAALGGTMLVLR
ncbi:SPOSA6832_01685, partial [Sporobolomyces salmonicolor]